jgi:uncharacterized protein YkwD
MFLRRLMMSSAVISILTVACIAESVLDYTNDLRASYGLPALKESRALSDYCMIYAAAMVASGYSSHDIWPVKFKQQVIDARAEEHGENLHGLRLYENVYSGPSDLTLANKKLAAVWIGSPIHEESILNPEALYIGVGYWRTGRMTYLCVVIAAP